MPTRIYKPKQSSFTISIVLPSMSIIDGLALTGSHITICCRAGASYVAKQLGMTWKQYPADSASVGWISVRRQPKQFYYLECTGLVMVPMLMCSLNQINFLQTHAQSHRHIILFPMMHFSQQNSCENEYWKLYCHTEMI